MANVLIIDDSSIMRRNLSTILLSAGHNVVAEATNGELGIKEYKRHKPDIITMDITMPVMDGISAVKQMIEFDPNAQIVMISSLDQKYMVLTALEYGAKHYIIKPFSPEKVLKVIDDVLNTTRGAFPKKRQKPTNSVTNTITDIGYSINTINAALKKLDTD